MLTLPDVTLICADTRTPELAIAAMQRCMALARFGECILFTDPLSFPLVPDGIRGEAVQIESVTAYSLFMLRGLNKYINTSHVLVVQWDGYALNAEQWLQEFLEYDYIGATFRKQSPERMVGNGGFSLRSKRLLQSLQSPEMVIHNPEDTCICHANRERLEGQYGIRFAPPQLAAKFSFERLPPEGKTFGFHGLFNMQRVLSQHDLHALVLKLPPALVCGPDARDLCRALIASNKLDTAAIIIEKRKISGLRDWRTLRLQMQHRWQSIFKRTANTNIQ